MWMIDPKMLCNKHLVAEHFEVHCMIGNLRKDGKWTRNLTAKGYLEPQNAVKRHDEIVEEMKRRGMNHNSPLDTDGITSYPVGKVDLFKSYLDLFLRCSKCRLYAITPLMELEGAFKFYLDEV